VFSNIYSCNRSSASRDFCSTPPVEVIPVLHSLPFRQRRCEFHLRKCECPNVLETFEHLRRRELWLVEVEGGQGHSKLSKTRLSSRNSYSYSCIHPTQHLGAIFGRAQSLTPRVWHFVHIPSIVSWNPRYLPQCTAWQVPLSPITFLYFSHGCCDLDGPDMHRRPHVPFPVLLPQSLLLMEPWIKILDPIISTFFLPLHTATHVSLISSYR
jgi:hypothetical protein